MLQNDLLSWRAAETTSGPRTPSSDGERTKATPRERWEAFVEAHAEVAEAMLASARAAGMRGERTSAKAIAEWARSTYRVSVNNSAISAFADWAIEREPALANTIERRARKGEATKRPAGCRGCGATDHSVPSCLTEGAALHWERSGKPERAAKVRRQIEALEAARGSDEISMRGAQRFAERLQR